MKLSGLHSLLVEDLTLPLVEGNKDNKDKDDDKDNKKDEKTKNKKNEDSDAARAYRGSGMSQQEIADKTGLAKSTISRLKSDEEGIGIDPSIDTLERLATAGVNPRQMVPNVFK